MGDAVLHSKHQNRAKPVPPSPSILGLVGEKPKGRGVLSHPLHVRPVIRPPPQVLKVLPEPAGQQWREGESFLTSCLAPLNCTRVLGSPRGLRAPSLPTLGNRLGSQRRQRRSAFSRPSSLQPEPARRGPAWGPPLAGGERHRPAVVLAPGAARISGALLARDSPCCPWRRGREEPRAGNTPRRPTHLSPKASGAAQLSPTSLVAALLRPLELHPEVESLGRDRPSPLIV